MTDGKTTHGVMWVGVTPFISSVSYVNRLKLGVGIMLRQSLINTDESILHGTCTRAIAKRGDSSGVQAKDCGFWSQRRQLSGTLSLC